MKAIYTAKVAVRGGRNGHVVSDDGHLRAPLAFPAPLGGDGRGTNPEQLFAAGYAACFASSLGAVAREAGVGLGQVDVDAEVDMLHDGEKRFDLAVRLLVRASGVDPASLAALVERTKEVCPYARATRGSLATEIRLEAP
jgi:lipoyl-dependent peroxiredoxin